MRTKFSGFPAKLEIIKKMAKKIEVGKEKEKAKKEAWKEKKSGEKKAGTKEKEGDKKLIAEKEKADKKKYERQIVFVVGLMVFIFIAFFVFFFVFKNLGNFTYEGIKFQKTTLGNSRIPIYRGEIFITRPDSVIKFNLYLRNDPRQLENISTDFSNIILRRYGYISFEPEISGCFGSSYASFRLAEILSALGMHVKGATTDPSLSEQRDIEWRNCDDAKKSNLTVIVLQHSNSNATTIYQEGNCYTIDIARCEVIPAAEKFILELAVELVKRNNKK